VRNALLASISEAVKFIVWFVRTDPSAAHVSGPLYALQWFILHVLEMGSQVAPMP